MKVCYHLPATIALRKGINHHGYQTLDFVPTDLSEIHRNLLSQFSNAKSNSVSQIIPTANFYLLGLTDNWGTYMDSEVLLDPLYVESPTVANLKAALDNIFRYLEKRQAAKKEEAERIQQKTKEEEQKWHARRTEEIAKFMTNPHYLPEYRYAGGTYRICILSDLSRRAVEIGANEAEIYAECDRRWQEHEAQRDREVRKKKEREESAQREREACLTQFITEHGTDSQKERMALGLLPEDERIIAFKNHIFAPLDRFPLYQKAKNEHEESCYVEFCRTRWETISAETVSANEWEVSKPLRKIAEEINASWNLRYHTGISECGGKSHKTGIRVTKQVGQSTFHQEYEYPLLKTSPTLTQDIRTTLKNQ